MKINVIGSILGTTGYDSHTKGLVNALYKINPDIKLDVPLVPNWMQLVNDAELDMIKKETRCPDATIIIMTPPNWRIALADNSKKNIGYCVWEGEKIPKYWIRYLLDERIDQIWVPSQHTKDAIWNTYWDGDEPEMSNGDKEFWNKVKIVPHGYDPSIFYSQRQKNSVEAQTGRYLEPRRKMGEEDKGEHMPINSDTHADTSFKFICNKGWRGGMEDRGGVQYVLKAYAEEFKEDENVELVLKLNPAYVNPQLVNQKINELGLPKGAAKIKVTCSNMTPAQLAKLYNECDVCVCATRAEAFDLGTAEAMACGLPVITTNYGGQIEHMDETCADFIDYKLEDVKGDVQYEGIKQAVPNVQHLRELMRASFSQGLSTREKGDVASKFISSWTWENSAQKALEFLK